jgi:hypothetical protein
MITTQKVTSNVQTVPRQSPDIYWHAELFSKTVFSIARSVFGTCSMMAIFKSSIVWELFEYTELFIAQGLVITLCIYNHYIYIYMYICIHEWALSAHWCVWQCIATLCLNSVLDGGWWSSHASPTLPQERHPVPTVQETEWATGAEIPTPTRVRSPDPPASSGLL